MNTDPDSIDAAGNLVDKNADTAHAGAGGYAATVLPVVQRHLDENHPLLALGAIWAYLDRDSGCADAHNDLAVVHHVCGHVAEALVCARRATELAPNNASYCRNLASILNAVGRFEEAIPVLVRILESDERDVEALVLLGDANYGLGSIADAKLCFQATSEIDPVNESARLRLGMAAFASVSEAQGSVAADRSLQSQHRGRRTPGQVARARAPRGLSRARNRSCRAARRMDPVERIPSLLGGRLSLRR